MIHRFIHSHRSFFFYFHKLFRAFSSNVFGRNLSYAKLSFCKTINLKEKKSIWKNNTGLLKMQSQRFRSVSQYWSEYKLQNIQFFNIFIIFQFIQNKSDSWKTVFVFCEAIFKTNMLIWKKYWTVKLTFFFLRTKLTCLSGEYKRITYFNRTLV